MYSSIMELLSSNYVIQQLYTNCLRPLYKRTKNVYNAECCICNEGKSRGKTRRLFYYPKSHNFYCFNCTKGWSEIDWLKIVTKKNFFEIIKEAKEFSGEINYVEKNQQLEPIIIPQLPPDSVNIFNEDECNFYKNKREDVLIQKALNYCKERRLLTAINKPSSLHVSFNDYVHKNRLIIPFYDKYNKIEYYQSRTLNANEHPKYLCKIGDKCLFGMYNIDYDIPYIFLFEGPIDAMFVKNGVAMAGITLTEIQEKFINSCMGMEIIYVFDNDKNNKETKDHIRKIIKNGKRVFIWPKEFKNFKDINEVCCKLQLDEFPYKYIIANTQQGMKAMMNI